MSLLQEAISYPTEQDDWLITILIGGVLSLFGFLLIPLFLVYGYLIRVIRSSLAEKPAPPTFSDWGSLLKDGVMAFVIGFVYFLIPTIVSVAVIVGGAGAMSSGVSGGTALGLATIAIGFLVSLLLTLLFGYVAVAALVNFAKEEQFEAGFDFTTIKAVVMTREYAVGWALAVAIFIGASIVISVLNIIPLLGTFVGAFVFFYAQIVAARLWARGFDDAALATAGTDPSSVGESAP